MGHFLHSAMMSCTAHKLSSLVCCLLAAVIIVNVEAFSGITPQQPPPSSSNNRGGDKIRSAAGNRPSLHPLTINSISDALRLRSLERERSRGEEANGEGAASGDRKDAIKIDVEAAGAEPLEVALAAGRIVTEALERRRRACEADDSASDAFDERECQTIAGRVVGVVMRMGELEGTLADRVGSVPWVRKYGEHSIFGLVSDECESSGEDTEGDDGGGDDARGKSREEVAAKILSDPLLRMSRAECLLALFLDGVEKPKLLQVGEEVPGGSECDFIDVDRLEVLRGQ